MVRKGEDLPNYIKNCTTNQWEQVLWSDKSMQHHLETVGLAAASSFYSMTMIQFSKSVP